jgi:hypothetical protein
VPRGGSKVPLGAKYKNLKVYVLKVSILTLKKFGVEFGFFGVLV